MPVKLINTLGAGGLGSTQSTLFGKLWPPEDVQAYWHMVPDWYVVRWWSALSFFTVHPMVDMTLDPDSYNIERRVMASEADKLATWMRVITELHHERHDRA